MDKKMAVLYMRMSTDMQEHSIASQERMLIDYAKRNNYLIIDKYTDEGISGQHASKRPSFLKLIEDSEQHTFQFVLIYDSSRFARNLVESLTYKKLLLDNGVRLISITEPNVEDDEMQLYFDAFSGASNEIYVRKLSKNVTRGHVEKCIRGEIAGTPSYGYYKDKYSDSYKINEEEADVIRYMFDAMLNDETYFSISSTLSQKGIKSKRGNLIDSRQVRRMLMNPAYKGYLRRTVGGQTFYKKCNLEPIVSEETFDKVQQIISERSSKYKKYDKPDEFRMHWLSGLLICPHCGGGYNYNKRGSQATRKPRFRCGNQTRGACKEGSSIMEDVIVNMVIDELRAVYSGPIESYIQNIRVPDIKNKLDYEKEFSRLSLQLKRAKNAYLEEIDTLEEYKDNKARITKEIDSLKELQAKENKAMPFDQEQFRAKLLNVITLLDDTVDMKVKISAARSIIDKIYVDPRKKEIELFFYA